MIFRFNPSGQEAVVPLENRNASGYILAFDNTNGIATGVAVNSVSPVSGNSGRCRAGAHYSGCDSRR